MATMADRAHQALAAIQTASYYASWPLVKLGRAIAVLLAPIVQVAQFVLLPVTYALHATLTLALIPFRLRLLERFEVFISVLQRLNIRKNQGVLNANCKQSIYIFFGIAALIGSIVGAIIYFSFTTLSSNFIIERVADNSVRESGRSTAEYRADRRKKKEETAFYATSSSSSSFAAKGSGASRRLRGLHDLS